MKTFFDRYFRAVCCGSLCSFGMLIRAGLESDLHLIVSACSVSNMAANLNSCHFQRIFGRFDASRLSLVESNVKYITPVN